MTFDAAVVGGGIVGCACAYFLSREGLRVAVVEPGPIGGGATAAGMGHVVVMDDSPAQFALTKRSQELWDKLETELPASAEFERRGTLWIASDEEEMGHVPGKAELYRSGGLRAEVLDAEALAEAEPNLRKGLAGALLVPGDAVVFPMPVAGWLLERALERGGERIVGRAIRITGRTVELDTGQSIFAGLVVNAAGDRAGELTPGLPIQPRKGHLVITNRYPGYVHHQLVELGYLKSAHSMGSESVAFNAQPRATGQILLGSSRQFVGFASSVEPSIVSKMLMRAMEFIPDLASLNAVRTWTGFRAATPDKLPLIGSFAGEEGLWIAAGHEGLGITTSLATGELIAELVCGRAPTLDPKPFDPNRSVHAHSS